MAGLGGMLGGVGGALGGALGLAEVEVVLNTAKLTEQLGAAEGEVAASSAEMEGSATASAGAISQGWLIAGAAVVAFGAMAVKTAIEHQAALAQLTVTAGANTEAYVKLAQAQESLTGFTEDETIAAETVLSHFQLTGDEMTKSIPIVEDYARAMGLDAATAAQNVGKAILGSTKAMKGAGIQFTATGNQANDLKTILGLLQDRFSGASAAYVKTFAGQMSVLSAQFDDLKIKVGTALLPSLTELVASFGKLMEAAGPLISGGFQVLASYMTDVADAARALTGDLSGLVSLLPDVGTSSDSAEQHVAKLGQSLFRLALLPFAPGAIAHLNDVGTAATGAGSAAATSAAQEQKLADAQRSVAEASKKMKDAEDALAGGILGLVAAQKTVQGDLKNLAELQRQGASGAKLHDAQLQLLNDQLSRNQDFKAYVDNLKVSNDTTQEAVGKVVALGHQVGLTRQQVLNILGPLDQYVAKLNATPHDVTTYVHTVYTSSHAGGATSHHSGGPGPGVAAAQSRSAGGVTVNVTTNDPEAAGRAIARRLRNEGLI